MNTSLYSENLSFHLSERDVVVISLTGTDIHVSQGLVYCMPYIQVTGHLQRIEAGREGERAIEREREREREGER